MQIKPGTTFRTVISYSLFSGWPDHVTLVVKPKNVEVVDDFVSHNNKIILRGAIGGYLHKSVIRSCFSLSRSTPVLFKKNEDPRSISGPQQLEPTHHPDALPFTSYLEKISHLEVSFDCIG